jgi:hypothetical protein
MNIRPIVPSQLPSVMAPTSMLLKPAVRGMTPWKNPASTRPGAGSPPSVAGLRHSEAVMNAAPATTSTTVVATVSLVCRDQLRGRRKWRRSSNSTGKPSPPKTTAPAIGRQIHGSVTKGTRLSL